MNVSFGTEARPAPRPWQQPGWFPRTAVRLDLRLAELGIRRTGSVREVRRWSLSAVLAVPTSDGLLYFKQTYPALQHEGPVIAALGSDSSSAVPEMVGSAPWAEGWFTRGVAQQPGSSQPQVMRGTALAALASVQRSWLGRVGELSGLGCWDRRPEVLATRIPALLRPELLGASSGPAEAVLSADEYECLAKACLRLPAICAELATAPPGNTLVHGDLHPGNWGIADADGRTVLLDWAEAAVGHPFYDIGPALRSADEAPARSRALAVCLEAWDGVVDRSDVSNIWRLAEPVAILNQLVTYAGFLQEAEPRDRGGWRLRLVIWARQLTSAVERALGPPPHPSIQPS